MKKDTLFVPFSRPALDHEEEEAVLRIMRSGWLTTGNETLLFEKEFAQAVAPLNTEEKAESVHALAVNSASSGLMLAMDACGIGPGTKILTTPYTFISTATSALHLGAEIVYADIEEDTYSISPQQIRQKLQADKTIRAIVPVHIAGNVCRMDEICSIAHEYGVKVIEDAAHAFPSCVNGRYAGTFGDAGVFSFYATKTITTAEGGMICTQNAEIAKRIELMRMHGIDRPVWDRYTSQKPSWQYDIAAAGWKCNLPDILSAIGRVQLKKAHLFYEQRKKIVAAYNDAFAPYDFFKTPPDGPGNAWHLYILRLKENKLSVDRDTFAAKLIEQGLGISVHFIPHFHMTFIRSRYGITEKDFPNAERQYQQSLTLPLWPGMTDEMIQQVIRTVIDTGKRYYAG